MKCTGDVARFEDGDAEAVFEWYTGGKLMACFVAAVVTPLQAGGLMITYAGLQGFEFEPILLAIGAAFTCGVTLIELAILRGILSQTMIVDKARREVRIRRFLSERRIPFDDIAEVGLVLYNWQGDVCVWPVLRTKAGRSIRLRHVDAEPYEDGEADSRTLRAKWTPVLETVARTVGAEARVTVK